jgi:hypothetical protein
LYQAYVLTVAPIVEPEWAPTALAGASEEPFESGVDSLAKYRELLAAYFPLDHWCFAAPPKTLENGQTLIVFDRYEQVLDEQTHSPNGGLRIPRCAVVFFPKVRDRGGAPPRDAIVLESSGGAMVQLERGLQSGVNGLGRFQYGQLLGEVIIRSDMKEPGPQDDLRLVTRDLYVNEDLIHTNQPVDVKLGEHHAYGRDLEIRRLKTDRPSGGGLGGLYGSFEDLVLKHDVTMTVSPSELRMGAANAAKPSATADGRQATGALGSSTDSKLLEAPIRIQSEGPFRIDFGSLVASFTDKVQVRQLHPDGKLDELLATEVKLFFTKATKWNAGGDGVGPTNGGGANQPFTLEPASLEAFGKPKEKVALSAPSHDASASGEHLWIEFAPQRITLERGDEVTLTYAGAEVHAPMVQYTLPPKNSGRSIGELSARGGAGRLRYVVDPTKPNEITEVTWKDAMQIVRTNGQPVVVLDGRPTVSMAGMGKLWADQLQLFLREQPANQTPLQPLQRGPLPASITPDRITASGRVAIESSQLTGKVNQLDIRFDQPANTPAPADGAADGPGTQQQQLFSPGGASQKSYDIAGVELKVDVAMRNRRPQVRAISVDGGVVFQELTPAAGGQPPMRIEAEHLRVTGADTSNGQIEIRGGGGQNGLPLTMAHITGGGATMHAPVITVNRGGGKAWINSPGQIDMLVDRNLSGDPLPTPEPMTIVWQQSMELDGRRITFLGDKVTVKNSTGWLRTRRLVAQTTGALNFDGGGGQQPRIEQLECWDGVVGEFEQRDVSGVSSRQHIELQSIIVNQLTGAITGDGPGKIDSVHLSKSSQGMFALPGGAAPAPQLVQANPELRHLHIDFVRGVSGDLRSSTVNVHGDVKAVYGPVANWDERLAMTPGGSPGPKEVWITSDSLGVTQSVAGRLADPRNRQIELKAEGRVTIEAQHPQQGALAAYGHRAEYDQAKSLFVLEWDGQTPATIQQQKDPGGAVSSERAQKIIFNLETGAMRIDGHQSGDFRQADPGLNKK